VRERMGYRRLRAAVIVLGILLLSLHWSIREEPCAGRAPLEVQVANEKPSSADVAIVVVDGSGRTVFAAEYHLGPGEGTSTGPIDVPAGDYRVTASVEGDGAGSETLHVDGCGGLARIRLTDDRITIVRSEEL